MSTSKLKELTKEYTLKLIRGKKDNITQIKQKVYDYVMAKLPGWAQLLFGWFIKPQIEKWTMEAFDERKKND